jgi:hypothetical protein
MNVLPVFAGEKIRLSVSGHSGYNNIIEEDEVRYDLKEYNRISLIFFF